MSTGITSAGRSETAPLDAERHMRSDARRNREHVLEAAGTLMATHGVDVSIDEIAELAHVGVGTVYRNFPTKGALLEALLLSRLEPLVAAAHAAAGSDDPGEAFVNFVRKLSDEMCDFKALADAMVASGVDIDKAKQTISAQLMAAVGALLEQAQTVGRIRPDVNIVDVSAMMMGLGHTDPLLMDAAQRSRCVALVCDSLLIDARSVLPHGTRTLPASS
jgi:AcrR family transcriptional regulator